MIIRCIIKLVIPTGFDKADGSLRQTVARDCLQDVFVSIYFSPGKSYNIKKASAIMYLRTRLCGGAQIAKCNQRNGRKGQKPGS